MPLNTFVFKAAPNVSPDFDTLSGAEADLTATGTIKITDSGVYNEKYIPKKDQILTWSAGQTPTIGKTSGGGRGGIDLTDGGLGAGDTVTIIGPNDIDRMTVVMGTAATSRWLIGSTVSLDSASISNIIAKCQNDFATNALWAFNGTKPLTISKCRIENDSGSAASIIALGIQKQSGTNTVKIQNCEWVGFDGAVPNVALDIDKDSVVAQKSVQVLNNSFYNCKTGIRSDQGGDFRNNAFGTITDDIELSGEASNGDFAFNVFGEQTDTGGFGTGNVFATDPVYVSPPADLKPGTGSPMIDAGTDTSSDGVTDDFFGVSRPQPGGGTYDIGAHELVQAGGVGSQTQIILCD